MKFWTLVLLGLNLVGPGGSNIVTDMRNVMLQLTKECTHQFSSCGEKLNVLDESIGNYCEATEAARNCSLTSTDYYDEEGSLTITGICREEEFNKLVDAACPSTGARPDTTNPPPSQDPPESNTERPRDQVRRRIDTRQEWDQLDDACRNHTLRCFNLDPGNTTTVLVDQALMCQSLTSVHVCITGNFTANSNSTSPCSTEEFNSLKDVACGAGKLNSSLQLLALFLMLAVSMKTYLGNF